MLKFENDQQNNCNCQPSLNNKVTPYANKGEYKNYGNQQKTIYDGRVYESINHGPYTVIRELWALDMKSRVFEVVFHNTGYHAIVTLGKMLSGEIKDKYVPSVYGIGYLGDEYYITDDKKRMYYKTWADMLKRCYDPTCKDYATYGGRGVTVDPRWYNFTTFYFDIQKIPGYWNKRADPKTYKLDKDYLQQHLPMNQRVYSKDTCVWISNTENALMSGRDNNQTGYYGVSREGYNNPSFTSTVLKVFYGRFQNVEDAAAVFNYVYPIMRDKTCTSYAMINPVPMPPFEELMERNMYYDRGPMVTFYNTFKPLLTDIYNSYLLGNPIY